MTHVKEHKRLNGITDVIFDYCGVLVDWQPRKPLEGQYPPGVIDFFLDPAEEYGWNHWAKQVDLGMGDEEALAGYDRTHGPAVTWVFKIWQERQDLAVTGAIDGMPELLRDLDTAGIRLWGLTNFTVHLAELSQASVPGMDLLRDTIVSAAVRLAKPDPAIYRLAIERFGLNPMSTAFVDDKPRNTSAAEEAVPGLCGIPFTGAADLRAALL